MMFLSSRIFFDLEILAPNGYWLLFTNAIIVLFIGRFDLVGLKAAFIQPTPTANGSNIEVSDKIGYALAYVYGLLMTVTLTIQVRLFNRGTTLKRDPISIANQLARS